MGPEVYIGEFNELKILRETEYGLALDGGQEFSSILLPNRYTPEKYKIGDKLKVFVYTDSEDRIVATTEEPYACVGQFALLKVVEIAPIGAFLDWGLSKDLLLPLGEMKSPVTKTGERVLVGVFLDENTNRVAASSRIGQFLEKGMPPYHGGEELEILVTEETTLGYKVIIEHRRLGFIAQSDAPRGLEPGETTKAFVKKILDDGKVHLTMLPAVPKETVDIQEMVLKKLAEKKGFLAIPEDANEETIFNTFGMNRKNYRKAIGALYRKRLIDIEPGGIRRTRR